MSQNSPNIPRLQDFVTFTRPRPKRFLCYSICLEILYWILFTGFIAGTFRIALENGVFELLSIGYALAFAMVEMVGRRRKRFRINSPELLRKTSQIPILYLRSFYYESSDRQVAVRQSGQKEEWHEKENDDEVLALALRDVSQLISVGSDSDRLPPLGAIRLYFKDDEWQEKVKELISIAQIVIIQPGYTTGTDWEINTLKEMSIPPEKIIFSFLAWQHLSRSDRQIHYEDFAMQINRIYRLKLPERINNSYFLYLDHAWQPHLIGLKGWKAAFFWLSSRPSLLWRLITFRFPSFLPLDWVGYLLRRLPAPRVFRRFSVPSVREAIRPIFKQHAISLPVWRTASYIIAWLGVVVFFSLASFGEILRMESTSPNSAKVKSKDVDIRNSILASPLVEYKGTKVPYTIQLRRAWLQEVILDNNPDQDYLFSLDGSPANIGIESISDRGLFSLASFPNMRLRALQQNLGIKGAQVRLIDSSPLLINGQNWIGAHIEIKLAYGGTVDEYSRAYVGNDGTICLIGTIANKNAFYLSLLEETFDSIRVDDRNNSGRKGNVQ